MDDGRGETGDAFDWAEGKCDRTGPLHMGAPSGICHLEIVVDWTLEACPGEASDMISQCVGVG